jgi:hypothetical protein
MGRKRAEGVTGTDLEVAFVKVNENRHEDPQGDAG